MRDEPCVIYVDGGTTQTRAWAVRGDAVVAHARAAVGARDTARDGSPARLRSAVADLIAEVTREVGKSSPGAPPSLVVAAGMITSPQGLCEVPHVPAPASPSTLAAGLRVEHMPDLGPLPIAFIPGVRSGPARCDPATVVQTDIMRGEEVLCLGALALGLLPAGGVVLNLGSHWKAIALDPTAGITGSVTTMSGELVHVVSTQTILASALPRERPGALDPTWVDAGAAAFLDGGLARALFCVRLLEQRADGHPDQRYAFALGAVMASDRAALVPAGVTTRGARVLVTGAHVVAEAWVGFLGRQGIDAALVNEADIDRAFRAGCRAVLAASPLALPT